MKLFLLLLLVSGACAGQTAPQQIQNEHARGLAQNPRDITAMLVIAGAGPTDRNAVELRVLFTSKRPGTYTAELAPGGNASAIDDFVFQGPDMPTPFHSKDRFLTPGIVCCGTDRHTVGETPIAARSFLSLDTLWTQIPNPLAKGGSATIPSRTPGDYWLFVETRRVLRGWPKSEKDSYFKASDMVVTSRNIVHFTILPDGSMGNPVPSQ